MNSKDYFESFYGSDDFAEQEVFDEAFIRLLYQTTAMQLEGKFQNRGLKFTQSFHGACPVQAWGMLDGMRFYFRFRSTTASLIVGPYNGMIEELYAFRKNQDRIERASQEIKRTTDLATYLQSMQFKLKKSAIEVVDEDNETFVPKIVVKKSSFTVPEDDSSHLSNEEIYAMFVSLVQNLEDVPADEQLPEKTADWLFEGRNKD